ncbi:hypothetical protein V3C99_001173 [Haemonchus contortus]
MAFESLLETCICDSSKIPQFYLKYFDWMVQVISVRCICPSEGSSGTHVLRVWDGHPITPEHKNVNRFSSTNAEMVVPSKEQLQSIPYLYLYDVLLYGEWISRAASSKSGSIVILKNVHFSMSSNWKTPTLVMHEGKSHGRDIIEVDVDEVRENYRYVKLMNEIDRVLNECRPVQKECDTTIASLQEDPAPSTSLQVNDVDEETEVIDCSDSSGEEIPAERKAALLQAFTLPSDPELILSLDRRFEKSRNGTI